MGPRTLMSYYGGKGMLAHKYPKPRYKTIIEPFAGGAAYSLRYYNHDVILCDTNKNTCAVWDYIINTDANTDIIPDSVDPGYDISVLIDKSHHSGLSWLLRMACNLGTGGTDKKTKTVTHFAAKHWRRNTITKIKHWNERISHWTIINCSYDQMDNIDGAWFIDPPYQHQGMLYKNSIINYKHLSDWSLRRRGQVIVFEMEGAKWLPFDRHLDGTRFRVKHVSSRKKESYFTCTNLP